MTLLCKLGFIAYPLIFTFVGTSVHDALKSCWFMPLCFCYVIGLIGALVVWKRMLPIFSLADIETILVTRTRWKSPTKWETAYFGNDTETEHKE